MIIGGGGGGIIIPIKDCEYEGGTSQGAGGSNNSAECLLEDLLPEQRVLGCLSCSQVL